jgi:hypothetical protein
MNAACILAEIRAAGGAVEVVQPGRLRLLAPRPLSPELMERVRANKPDIIHTLLNLQEHVKQVTLDPATFAERAAIIEANGIPRAWAEGFAQLDQGQPPDNVPERRWRLFIEDCGRFLDGGLAKQAAALGWGPLHLFGCDRDSPLMRIDHAGLLWLIEGRKLVAMTGDTAVIECEDGNRLTFYRRPAAVGQVVLAWNLTGLCVA